MKTDATYPPLNTLKPAGDHLWIVDGPIIRFGPRWLKMPFPTRMTIIRLSGNWLLIHSPTPLTATLAENIMRIGTPRWIIGPNRLHYWWVTEWHAAYPEADIYLHHASRSKQDHASTSPLCRSNPSVACRGMARSTRSRLRAAT